MEQHSCKKLHFATQAGSFRLRGIPLYVTLQEFLPAARPVGCNELEVASTLSGFPDLRWQAAAASLSADPPVVPILGFSLLSSDSRLVLTRVPQILHINATAKLGNKPLIFYGIVAHSLKHSPTRNSFLKELPLLDAICTFRSLMRCV